MKQIVMFSGGASSAYTAKLAVDKYGKDNTILLHTPTYAEHPDADRFREQISNYLDIPITIQQDGRNLWQLIKDNNCLPSMFIPFCTQQLKIKQTDIFLKNLSEKVNIHYGYGTDEYRRIQKVYARLLYKGYQTEFLVYDNGIKDDIIKKIIQNEWKIELPQPYKYLKHNNCIPCWKGGKNHFMQVCKYYPEQYEKAIEMEELIGHTVFKGYSLKELKKEVMKTKNQISFLDDDFHIPCECMD